MSTHARFTVVLAAALALAACAAETEIEPDDQVHVLVWPTPTHTDVVADTDQPGTPVPDPDLEPLEVSIHLSSESANVCTCNGPSCVSHWIESTFGCDVCVYIDCAGSGAGGCVRCPSDPTLSTATARSFDGDLPAYEPFLQAE